MAFYLRNSWPEGYHLWSRILFFLGMWTSQWESGGTTHSLSHFKCLMGFVKVEFSGPFFSQCTLMTYTFWLATIGCWLSLGFRFCWCSLIPRWFSLISAFSFCPSDHASILWSIWSRTWAEVQCCQDSTHPFWSCKVITAFRSFCAVWLKFPYADSVLHLSHTLRYDLNDSDDIIGKTYDMIRKANCMLNTFSATDVLTNSKFFQSYCFSLYGSALWNLSCREIRTLEVAFNRVLRRISWSLPAHSHTTIIHCTAKMQSIFNIIMKCSNSLLSVAKASSSLIVNHVFLNPLHLATLLQVLMFCMVIDIIRFTPLMTSQLLVLFIPFVCSSLVSEQLIVSLSCN